MRKQKLQQYHNFLIANGHEIVKNHSESDVILLWTCAFRKDVRDNSLSEIERYQRESKAELIVTGCLPDIAPDLLGKCFKGRVIRWCDDREKMEKFFGCKKCTFDSISPTFVEGSLCTDTETYRKENPDKDVTFHDQFIKLIVSEGCNYQCSYCSERLAFPPYRSFSEAELIETCRRMTDKTGHLEIMLLADSLGDYGCDSGSNLPALIRELKTLHPDLKIALNNLNPAGFIKFVDDMVEFLQKGYIRHLNLPIQSASEHILKLMNRPYTRKDIDKIFTLLNNINFTEFDTHLIVGFPGETEDAFKETVRFILRHRPKYILASGFMESEGMAASKLPDKVDDITKSLRLLDIEKQAKAAGIICNTDSSELGSERLRRLNYV
jgi:MiaB/RimO family radical SAM methylthiotransferase